MGIGNTREEIIEVYKEFPNISVIEENLGSQSTGSINLRDLQSGTTLQFILENKICTSIIIFKEDEGCGC